MNTGIPHIFFESGYLLDLKYDFENPDNPIAEKSRPRVQELLKTFDQIWTEEGGKLLSTTVKEIGLPFRRKELSCTVTVNPNEYSCSHPLIINAARFFTVTQFSRIDRLRFIDILYHELLHRYLDDHFEKALDISSANPSPLMLKYEIEDIFTHAHVHLYALQKFIFQRLGLDQNWAQVLVWAQEIPVKGYQRALEIVEIEGAETFVAELKTLARSAG